MKIRCLLPFIHLEIADAGRTLCCCWGKYDSLGDLKKKTITEVWNGKKFQLLRKKIYENRFDDICDRKRCHILLSGRSWSKQDLKKEKLPDKLIISRKISMNFLNQELSKKLLKI